MVFVRFGVSELCCSTRRARARAHTPDPQAQEPLLLLFNTTRTTSGPPSTRAAITMDGGVADTARANTPVLTQAVNRRSLGEEGVPD